MSGYVASLRAGLVILFVLLVTDQNISAQARPVAIVGGKLIDGTGRPPTENSTIIIQGRKFTAAGTAGEIAVPAGAQVIDVTGKTVLPGFIDGHGHLEDFHGELYLHLGITTCANIELYQDGPWTLAQKARH